VDDDERKEEMKDLSKIDWTKCELPMWQTMKFDVKYITGINHPIHIRNHGIGAVAVRGASDGSKWRIGTRELTASFTELDDLKAICAKVDAFIETEMRRGVSKITIEGTENIVMFADEWSLERDISGYERLVAEKAAPGFAKPEEALPPWRDCTLEEAMANPECSEFIWISSSDVAKTSWLPIGYRKGEFTGGSYGYRTHAPKAEAKMPTVKAPDGWRWERSKYPLDNPGWHLRSDHCGGKGLFRHVPHDKSERDAMLACVAAYDDADGAAHIKWDSTTWVLVETMK
jgi:hypothetical protein